MKEPQFGDIFWGGAPPHVGRILARLREERGLSMSWIADHAPVSLSTVSRMENEFEGVGLDSFVAYVSVLRDHDLLKDKVLLFWQAQVLIDLYVRSQSTTVEESQEELACIKLTGIRDRSRETPYLRDLLDQLKNEDRPAYIRDNLWFVHAYNGAILHLFGIDMHNPENFKSWFAWHVIGTKFYADSPIRRTHVNADLYFAQTISRFWREVKDYLFTRQVRALATRIKDLSYPHRLGFEKWWDDSNRLVSYFDARHFTRELYFPGFLGDRTKSFMAESDETGPTGYVVLEPDQGYGATYTLVKWNPRGASAEELFSEIRSRKDSRRIIYAADYDHNQDFHVNDWPEVGVRAKQSPMPDQARLAGNGSHTPVKFTR